MAGLNTQILNQNEDILNKTEIVILNSFGVLNDYFEHAKSVFIGKSMVKKLKNDSGQNPIDAAYLNCKIYHGPYVSNFYEVYEILKQNEISQKIENHHNLSQNLIEDLKNTKKVASDKSNNIQILGKNILLKTMKTINNFLYDKIS